MAADALVPAEVTREEGELTAPFVWPDMLGSETAPEPAETGGNRPAQPEPAATELALPQGRPGWLDKPAPPPPHVPEPLRPSRALAEPDAPAETPLQAAGDDLAGPAAGLNAAMQRGQAIHTLLQHLPGLPDDRRTAVATGWLMQNFPEAAAYHGAWIAEACAVIAHPDLAGLFGPGSRAEVPIAGYAETETGRHAVSGQIDRLSVTKDGIRIVDFKTDRSIPAGPGDVDPAYITQLALYRRLVAQARGMADGAAHVETALVWTAGPVVMPLSAALLDGALAAIGVLPVRAA
jgi:ATP-dependent helicase/nuclease subunit A